MRPPLSSRMAAPLCQFAGPEGAMISWGWICDCSALRRRARDQRAEATVGLILMMMGRKLLPAGVGVEVGVLACAAVAVRVDVAVRVALGVGVKVGAWVALGVGVEDEVGVTDGVGVPLGGGLGC